MMRHDYLRKSMVDRIERKSLLAKYHRSIAQDTKDRSLRMTRAQHLRSQSVLDQMSSAGSNKTFNRGNNNYSPAAHKISSQFKHNITTSKNNSNEESRFNLSKDISRAYSDNKGGLASRRKSHGSMININASQKNINAIALAMGKKINPLPPIEQY